MSRKINFYYKTNGDCPVRDFLDGLSGKVAKKITWTLEIVESMPIIPKKYFKYLNGEIYEVRVVLGSNIYRILCFFDDCNIILLTNGFVKKTKKTPEEEISAAKRYREDYLRRKNHE